MSRDSSLRAAINNPSVVNTILRSYKEDESTGHTRVFRFGPEGEKLGSKEFAEGLKRAYPGLLEDASPEAIARAVNEFLRSHGYRSRKAAPKSPGEFWSKPRAQVYTLTDEISITVLTRDPEIKLRLIWNQNLTPDS